MLNHLELQAEKGKKFSYNESPAINAATYSIYINECLIGDNTIHVQSGEKQITYLNHGGLNFMGTSDKRFCDYTYNNLQNIIRKSTYISVIGEKERSIFFNSLREKIYEKKKRYFIKQFSKNCSAATFPLSKRDSFSFDVIFLGLGKIFP